MQPNSIILRFVVRYGITKHLRPVEDLDFPLLDLIFVRSLATYRAIFALLCVLFASKIDSHTQQDRGHGAAALQVTLNLRGLGLFFHSKGSDQTQIFSRQYDGQNLCRRLQIMDPGTRIVMELAISTETLGTLYATNGCKTGADLIQCSATPEESQIELPWASLVGNYEQ